MKTRQGYVYISLVGVLLVFCLHFFYDMLLCDGWKCSNEIIAEPTGIPGKSSAEINEIYIMPEGLMIEVDGELVPYVCNYSEEEKKIFQDMLNTLE